MGENWRSFPTARAAAEACAEWMASLLREAVAAQDRATLAVSGGTTPQHLFESLVAMKLPWGQVHLFWVDERSVPPSDAQSNYRLAEECFIAPARFPRENVHRVLTELGPEDSAQRYAEEIRSFFGLREGEMPRFDVIHCGMGYDAHTASLFPGEPLIDDRTGIAAAVLAESLGQWRITLLPGVLLAASHTAFLVAGDDKAEAVRAVLTGSYDPKRYPAQIACREGRNVVWFFDDAAARLMLR